MSFLVACAIKMSSINWLFVCLFAFPSCRAARCAPPGGVWDRRVHLHLHPTILHQHVQSPQLPGDPPDATVRRPSGCPAVPHGRLPVRLQDAQGSRRQSAARHLGLRPGAHWRRRLRVALRLSRQRGAWSGSRRGNSDRRRSRTLHRARLPPWRDDLMTGEDSIDHLLLVICYLATVPIFTRLLSTYCRM